VRHVLGDVAADLLGVPDDRWKYAPSLVAPVIRGLEMVRAAVPGGREWAIRAGRGIATAHVERMLEGNAATFASPSPSTTTSTSTTTSNRD
jgi:hypothetical protein